MQPTAAAAAATLGGMRGSRTKSDTALAGNGVVTGVATRSPPGAHHCSNSYSKRHAIGGESPEGGRGTGEKPPQPRLGGTWASLVGLGARELIRGCRIDDSRAEKPPCAVWAFQSESLPVYSSRFDSAAQAITRWGPDADWGKAMQEGAIGGQRRPPAPGRGDRGLADGPAQANLSRCIPSASVSPDQGIRRRRAPGTRGVIGKIMCGADSQCFTMGSTIYQAL
jgi:hypothetical protein